MLGEVPEKSIFLQESDTLVAIVTLRQKAEGKSKNLPAWQTYYDTT